MDDNGRLFPEPSTALLVPSTHTISDANSNIRNEILLGLSPEDLNLLLPRLEHVHFKWATFCMRLARL
jgi:hypothetical protein